MIRVRRVHHESGVTLPVRTASSYRHLRGRSVIRQRLNIRVRRLLRDRVQSQLPTSNPTILEKIEGLP